MNILLTGGAGYIGSHTLVELIDDGHSVVVVDNLTNSRKEAVKRAEKLTGKRIPFYEVDIRDRDRMNEIFQKYKFDCCMHFAGLKAIAESIEMPLAYYDNNINGTLALIDLLRENECKNIIHSSSATVYGTPIEMPVSESCPMGECTNPYGWTKWMQEKILADVYKADNEWNIVLLRYFNPIGAHPSGLLGEDPNGVPSNLMPRITAVAAGKEDKLHIYGNDYDTPDGTCIRDYIHVVDLARGHVKALKEIKQKHGLSVFNLGTGNGYSVLEIVRAFEHANAVKIPYVIDPRRNGDVTVCYSDPSKAYERLGWRAEYGIEDMCRDAWRWQRNSLQE